MSESDPSDSAGEGTGTQIPKKKMKYAQKYKEKWEALPEFDGWLTKSHKGKEYALCKCCNKDIIISSGKNALIKHKKSKAHQEKFKTLLKQPTIAAFTKSVAKQKKLDQQIKEGEIRLSAFVAEHNLPLTMMDHLPKLIASVCKDSNIAAGMACGRTKANGIVTNVIGDIPTSP